MRDEPFVPALGALSGGQAVQSVKAGLKAIYCSGWQVAADANTAGQVYPDQSLYPADAVPTLVKRLNRALTRADQIEHAEGGKERRFGVFFSPTFRAHPMRVFFFFRIKVLTLFNSSSFFSLKKKLSPTTRRHPRLVRPDRRRRRGRLRRAAQLLRDDEEHD